MPNHNTPKIELVNLKDLTVDLNSQQPLKPAKVKKMTATGFDPLLAGTLIVSRREDGTMVILDGQHRTAAALDAGIEQLPAMVFDGLTPEEEAAMFLGHNEKSNPSAISKFRVAVNAGNELENKINDIIVRYGWKVIEGKGKRPFRSVGAAYDIFCRRSAFNRPNFRVDGAILFAETMQAITEAWDGDPKSTHASIVKAVGYFLQTYWKDVDLVRLSRQLATVKPESLIASIRASKDALGVKQEVAGGYEVVNIYNEKLRSNRLDRMELF